MTKKIFENRYNRKSYLDFCRNKLLPDDFETCIEKVELSRSYRFIKEMFIIGECKSLDLLVIESSILSIMNPRSMPIKEIMSIIKQYLFANLIIITVPTKKRHYRMSLITSELHLNSNKVKQITEITKTKSLYLGTKFRRLDRKDFYVPLLRKSNIKTIEDLNIWFLESHKLTFFKPYYKKYPPYSEIEKAMEEEKREDNINLQKYIDNPFKSRFECLINSNYLTNDEEFFEEYDEENVIVNYEHDIEERYIISAYNGFEYYNKGNYKEAIKHFNKALNLEIGEPALLHSTLAKCHYHEDDFDSFMYSIVTIIDLDVIYIDDEHRYFFQKFVKDNEFEE